jgi:hypothetical protein
VIAENQAKAGMGFGGGGYMRGGAPVTMMHQQEIWGWVTDAAGSSAGIGWLEEFWSD